MSQHRAALAAILVAVVALFALSVVPATAAPPAPTNPLVAAAVKYDGTWQGECWAFVKKIVRDATGQEMGFDYRQGYFDAGAIEVSIDQAQPGDLIQIAKDSDSGPSADYPGLHNSIVVANLGGGLFDIIDSNQNFDGVVHFRKNYSPAAAIARYPGLNFHFYRIVAGATARTAPGTAPSLPALAAPTPGHSFSAGERARVYTPGDVLNLRSGAGRDAAIVGRLAHGTSVTVLSGPTSNSGLVWLKVSTPIGEGWVAADFLTKDSPVTPSAAGAVTPILQFRSYIPLAAID